MNQGYSKSLGGFFDTRLIAAPLDAVMLSNEECEALRFALATGKRVDVSEEGVVIAVEPLQSLAGLAKSALAQVNAEYTKRMGAIADAYPLHERESWPVQLQEARMVLDYVGAGVLVPETMKTPWIDQCAAQRGLTREELAVRIVAKDGGYREISGFLSGVRQWHEDCIAMLLQDGEDAREALQGYDHLQGWEQSAPV